MPQPSQPGVFYVRYRLARVAQPHPECPDGKRNRSSNSDDLKQHSEHTVPPENRTKRRMAPRCEVPEACWLSSLNLSRLPLCRRSGLPGAHLDGVAYASSRRHRPQPQTRLVIGNSDARMCMSQTRQHGTCHAKTSKFCDLRRARSGGVQMNVCRAPELCSGEAPSGRPRRGHRYRVSKPVLPS